MVTAKGPCRSPIKTRQGNAPAAGSVSEEDRAHQTHANASTPETPTEELRQHQSRVGAHKSGVKVKPQTRIAKQGMRRKRGPVRRSLRTLRDTKPMFDIDAASSIKLWNKWEWTKDHTNPLPWPLNPANLATPELWDRDTATIGEVVLILLTIIYNMVEPAYKVPGQSALEAFQRPAAPTLEHSKCMVMKRSRKSKSKSPYIQLKMGKGKNKRPVNIGAHRIVCWLCHGEPEGDDRLARGGTKQVVAHRDKHPACCSTLCANPCDMCFQLQSENAMTGRNRALQKAKAVRNSGIIKRQKRKVY